jgi:hypothetical protein
MDLNKNEVGARVRYRDNDPPNRHQYLQLQRRMLPHTTLADVMARLTKHYTPVLNPTTPRQATNRRHMADTLTRNMR